jgi:hypothetical protein
MGYHRRMAASNPALKSLPPQARRRIEKLESTVAELTGALGQVVAQMQRQGLFIDVKKPRSPLLSSLVKRGKQLQPKAHPPTQAQPSLAPESARQGGPAKSQRGLASAVARGEAAKVEWVRSGEVIPAKTLAHKWGLTPQALGPASERGEVFAIVVKRQRYFPREFVELERDVVGTVSKSLGRLTPEEKLVFWKRPHGALGGKTVAQFLGPRKDGPQLVRVRQLARAWAAQAQSQGNGAAAA